MEIARASSRTVEGEVICADDEELNAMGSQGPDELVEVGREPIHLPPQVFDRRDTLGWRPRQPVAERRSVPLFLYPS